MCFGRVLPLLLIAASAVCGESTFYLKDGDRVVFYGDSITDQRLYTLFTETYAVTRFPHSRFTFVHSGWGGDRVSGGGGGPIDVRLQRDVIAYQPTVMTIMLGMNDAGYKPFDSELFNRYVKGYEHLLDVVQSALPKIRITAIQPSPFDDVTQEPKFEGGYNAVLLRYAGFVRQISESVRIDTADLNRPVVEALKRAKETDPELAKKLIPDRVHPGEAGHLLMSEALLKAWHAPAMVSDVELDAKSHRETKVANAKVSDWVELHWTTTENALPMPIDWKDPVCALAVHSSDFLEALDQETLRVSGLKEGKWQLKIDEQSVGSFTSGQLERGINLSQFDTPMMKQALAVQDLVKKRTDVHNVRWRDIQVPLQSFNGESKDAAIKALDRLDEDLTGAERKAAQPEPHKFELVAQS